MYANKIALLIIVTWFIAGITLLILGLNFVAVLCFVIGIIGAVSLIFKPDIFSTGSSAQKTTDKYMGFLILLMIISYVLKAVSFNRETNWPGVTLSIAVVLIVYLLFRPLLKSKVQEKTNSDSAKKKP